MKTIIAEVSPNNQVTVRYVSRPNCLPARNVGDSSCDREMTLLAKYQQKVERIYAKVRNASIEYLHDNSKRYDVKQDIKDHFRNAKASKEIFSMSRYKGSACTIPSVVEYKEIIGKKAVLVQKTCSELAAERAACLDIIKKSQQTKKYERPWGRLQADKKFTRNAKQKILEAGAVVDKCVGVANSYEVTLTVPGSGWDVYDVVSRWSGYLVNRITQIIRRIEAKGIEVHWFFVWEHQQRGALHMHWCIAVKDKPKVANLIGCEIVGKWYALLEELSVKTGIDLFKKRGFLGTWRHNPEVWQCNIARVRKSVGAYFSKYCSKNANTDKFNTRRRAYEARKRDLNPDCANSARVYSLSPSRYWGCSMRTKRLCAKFRVTIRLDVASSREGNWIYKIIREWLDNLCPGLKEVSRTFKKVSLDTGFEYARGWENKLWFKAEVIDEVVTLFKRIYANQQRKTDGIGAFADMYDF